MFTKYTKTNLNFRGFGTWRRSEHTVRCLRSRRQLWIRGTASFWKMPYKTLSSCPAETVSSWKRTKAWGNKMLKWEIPSPNWGDVFLVKLYKRNFSFSDWKLQRFYKLTKFSPAGINPSHIYKLYVINNLKPMVLFDEVIKS